MTDIPYFKTFAKIIPIAKGLSSDKKFYIETLDDKHMFLRLSDIKEFDRKKAEYEMMKRFFELGVLTPEPYAFGLCNKGKSVYCISEWLEGENAEDALPHMSEKQQYSVGVKAGAVLRKIHTLPAPEDAGPWDVRFRNKVQKRIDLYHQYHLESENGERIIQYLHDKQDLLSNRPQTFWHGDFSIGNHMIMPNGEVGTIDFNSWNFDYGDPWWEFVAIPWGKQPPSAYYTGMINGYFDGKPPHAFFDLLSYYFACDALSALCYASLGLEPCKPEDGKMHMENVLRWFYNMKHSIPIWYKTNSAH